MEEDSRRRNQGGGIKDKESLKNHRGGIMEQSWEESRIQGESEKQGLIELI